MLKRWKISQSRAIFSTFTTRDFLFCSSPVKEIISCHNNLIFTFCTPSLTLQGTIGNCLPAGYLILHGLGPNGCSCSDRQRIEGFLSYFVVASQLAALRTWGIQWTPGSSFPLVPRRSGTLPRHVISSEFISCIMSNTDGDICEFLNILASHW